MDSNIKTLVIDDDEDICDILKQFLESSGYTVDVAMSGKEAIQTIGEKTFDVAITDLDLGDMSGLEVIKSIKQLQPTAEVIMLSGYGKAEHASEAIGLGASAYIQKPITFSEVDMRVKEALAKRQFAVNVDQIMRKASESDIELVAHLEQVLQLYEMGKRLMSTMDSQLIIDTVLGSLISIVRCEGAFLLLTEENKAKLYIFSDWPMTEETLRDIRIDAQNSWRTLQRKEIDEDQIETIHQARLVGEKPKNLESSAQSMKAPLSVQDKMIGILSVYNLAAGTPVSQNVQYLPYIVGNLAALALDNASLHHHTRTLALTDGLTGLLNYRAFVDRLGQEFDRSQRYQSILSLVILDIDHFKAVNDTYGHLQGDLVLEEVSNILRRTSRESDILARYGGEEFVMLLPETNAQQGLLKADRIREKIAGHEFMIDKGPIDITVSLGVATCPNPKIDTPEDLMEIADQALYKSKSLGRNRATLSDITPP